MESLGHLFDERGDGIPVGGIDLLPIEKDSACFGLLHCAKQLDDERRAMLRGAVGEIFHRFRLPFVADQVAYNRHKDHSLRGGNVLHLGNVLEIEGSFPIGHARPVEAKMSELGGVFVQGAQAVGIPVIKERSADSLVGLGPRQREFGNGSGERSLGAIARFGKLLPIQDLGLSQRLLLQGSDLPFDLANRRGEAQLRLYKKRLDEPGERHKQQQRQEYPENAQTRPPFSGRVMEDKRGGSGRGHEASQS